VRDKIPLCASCADAYRKAKIPVDPDYKDRDKYTCAICKAPWGMTYFIERPDIVPRCPHCDKRLIKTETLDAVYLSCKCGYEARQARVDISENRGSFWENF
jgi:hypothetical protein